MFACSIIWFTTKFLNLLFCTQVLKLGNRGKNRNFKKLAEEDTHTKKSHSSELKRKINNPRHAHSVPLPTPLPTWYGISRHVPSRPRDQRAGEAITGTKVNSLVCWWVRAEWTNSASHEWAFVLFVCMCACLFVCLDVCMCLFLWMYVCMFVWIFDRIFIDLCGCLCVCMYVYLRVRIIPYLKQ